MNFKKYLFVFMVLLGIILSEPHQHVSAEVSDVSYTGEVSDRISHNYYFSILEPGILNIESKINVDDITLILSSTDTMERYINGEHIPQGNYKLIVTGKEKILTSYKILLNGLYFENKETAIPNLSIIKPLHDYTRLPKNTPIVNIAGGSDGINTYITTNWLNQIIQVGNNFSSNIRLGVGLNNISINTENNFGNEVNYYKTVVSPGLKRISGSNRYEVSANISKEISNWGYQSDTIILATGESFPDALSAVPLAVKEKSPLLLTSKDYLPASIKLEIQRISPEKAIILGGSGAISPDIEVELRNLGINSIERLGGANRFAVSTNIAEQVITERTRQAIIVNGTDFPDALSVASYAGIIEQPILLVRKDTLPSEVTTFLDNNPNISSFIIVGGTLAVSEGIKNALESYGGVYRISGLNRYDTSAQVSEFYNGLGTYSVVIANGLNFPDALSGAVLAALRNDHFSLISPNSVPQATENLLYKLYYHNGEEDGIEGIDSIYILGGTGAVSTEVENKIEDKFIK